MKSKDSLKNVRACLKNKSQKQTNKIVLLSVLALELNYPLLYLSADLGAPLMLGKSYSLFVPNFFVC